MKFLKQIIDKLGYVSDEVLFGLFSQLSNTLKDTESKKHYRYVDLPTEKKIIHSKLPERFNHSRYIGQSENQYNIPLCTCAAADAILKYHYNKKIQDGGDYPAYWYDFSQMLLYFKWCKIKDGIPNLSGTYPNIMLKGITKKFGMGMAYDFWWPMAKKLEDIGIPVDGWKYAQYFHITDYWKINGLNFDEIRDALQFGPIAMSLKTTSSFFNSKGVVNLLSFRDKTFGLHEVIITDCDTSKKETGKIAFQIYNSWGDDWGDGGKAWVTFDYIKEMHGDIHAVRCLGDSDEL